MEKRVKFKFKNFLMKYINNKASTLIVSVITLTVFLTIGMIVSNVIIKDIGSNREYGESKYAYYAAQMGLKKAIWLLNNEVYTYNGNSSAMGNFYESSVDMCSLIISECPCPIEPLSNSCVDATVVSPGSIIIDDDINGANYKVYALLSYNNGTDGLNRKLTITSIGKFNNTTRKLEYSTCIGNFCGR